jgi:hypothetical protein
MAACRVHLAEPTPLQELRTCQGVPVPRFARYEPRLRLAGIDIAALVCVGTGVCLCASGLFSRKGLSYNTTIPTERRVAPEPTPPHVSSPATVTSTKGIIDLNSISSGTQLVSVETWPLTTTSPKLQHLPAVAAIPAAVGAAITHPQSHVWAVVGMR